MKKIGIIALLSIGFSGINSCDTSKKQATVENKQELSVTGEITAIEYGKDGYTATIKDSNGKEYDATISIINLNKSGGEYKTYNVGEKIAVKGPIWKDGEGKIHITVYDLKEDL